MLNIKIKRQKFNFSDSEYNKFKIELIKNDLAKFNHLENRWSFLESMYFCLVVITTIGYGHT